MSTHLSTQAGHWATPNACERGPESKASKDTRGSGGIDLQTQVQAWPTPTVGDSKQTASSEASKKWPSPRAEDSESCGNHPGATDSLTGATRGLASPAARDEKGANGLAHLSRDRPHEDQLANQAVHSFAHSAHQDATTTANGLDSLLKVWTRPSSPRLSPAFQWWLMRFPHPRAIYCGSAATEWTHWLRQMRSCVRGIALEV